MCELDVFAENLTLVDWDIHEMWIRGLGVTEAVAALRRKSDYDGDIPQDLLVSDLNDHYRLYANLESLLLTVGNFSDQGLFLMGEKTRNRFVERYYSLDTVLCRELLGRKLNSRLRKDLDEVAEKTGVHLKSCRRQFDNIKRIFKAVEDAPGNYVDNVRKMFRLPTDLAEKYATLVFVFAFRFEMHKKKMASATFDSVKRVSLILMASDWLTRSSRDGEPCLDRDFLAALKELKLLVDRDKEHRNAVVKAMTRSADIIETNFKPLSRNVLMLGVGLGKDSARDFFVHVQEKVAEPMRQLGLEAADVDAFLTAYAKDDVLKELVSVEESIKQTLKRFMTTLRPCLIALY